MSRFRSLIRVAISLVAFFGALAGGAHIISRLDPFGDVPTVREKWAHWKRHKDEYDTVFIGTSRTFRGIKPSVFDSLTAEAGTTTRTFNFGVDGMFPPEDSFVAETILADPPKNLRWVFLELGVFMEDFEDRAPDSLRSVYWHDWARTSLCSRALLWPKQKSVKWKKWFEQKEGKESAAAVTATHWRLWLSRTLNLGRGTGDLNRFLLGRKPKAKSIGENNDGFLPMGGDGIMRGKELEDYERAIAQRREKPARIVPINPYAEESMMRVVRRVRELGARPIVYLAPTSGHLRGHPAEGSGIPIFDFCDLQAYPELYEASVRTDVAHVNAIGADRFTRHMAGKFIELTKSQPPSR